MPYSVLLFEQNPETPSLTSVLNGDNFRVVRVFSADEAEMWLAANVPHAVVVNLLKEGTFPENVRQLPTATRFNVPWVVVSDQKQKIEDCIFCTADDLFPTMMQAIQNSTVLHSGPFALDTQTQSLWAQGEAYHLTPKLTLLMALLLENSGQIVYRKTIMQHVWKTDYMGDTRTLDVHIRWLREIIEVNPSRPKFLLTVRGAGYRLVGSSTPSLF